MPVKHSIDKNAYKLAIRNLRIQLYKSYSFLGLARKDKYFYQSNKNDVLAKVYKINSNKNLGFLAKYARCELEIGNAVVEYICKKTFDVRTRSAFFIS